MEDAKPCEEAAAQEIERGGQIWDAEQAELVRLARLAWPDTAADVREPDEDDPLDVVRTPGEFRVWNPYEEDSVGLSLVHPKAHDAGLFVLRLLVGELDLRAIVDAKAFGEAYDRAAAENTRLMRLLESRDSQLRSATNLVAYLRGHLSERPRSKLRAGVGVSDRDLRELQAEADAEQRGWNQAVNVVKRLLASSGHGDEW